MLPGGAPIPRKALDRPARVVRVLALVHREGGHVHDATAPRQRHRLVEQRAPPVDVRRVEDARGELARVERAAHAGRARVRRRQGAGARFRLGRS